MLGRSDSIWLLVDDIDDLREVESVLVELEQALVRERAAVADMDPMALARISNEKRDAAERLEAVANRCNTEKAELGATAVARPDDPEYREARERVTALLRNVRVSATANSILLQEASEAVAEALGLRSEATTYDQQARRRASTNNFTTKAA